MTNDQFLNDQRVRQLLAPEVLAVLEANQPPADASPDFQIGHWAAVAATALTEIVTLKQRITELEADA
jgi:hypothetical protein